MGFDGQEQTQTGVRPDLKGKAFEYFKMPQQPTPSSSVLDLHAPITPDLVIPHISPEIISQFQGVLDKIKRFQSVAYLPVTDAKQIPLPQNRIPARTQEHAVDATAGDATAFKEQPFLQKDHLPQEIRDNLPVDIEKLGPNFTFRIVSRYQPGQIGLLEIKVDNPDLNKFTSENAVISSALLPILPENFGDPAQNLFRRELFNPLVDLFQTQSTALTSPFASVETMDRLDSLTYTINDDYISKIGLTRPDIVRWVNDYKTHKHLPLSEQLRSYQRALAAERMDTESTRIVDMWQRKANPEVNLARMNSNYRGKIVSPEFDSHIMAANIMQMCAGTWREQFHHVDTTITEKTGIPPAVLH